MPGLAETLHAKGRWRPARALGWATVHSPPDVAVLSDLALVLRDRRRRVQTSSLMDAARSTRHLESAYREMDTSGPH